MFDIKESLKELPDKPGVYMHKDQLGQIIYVGKASSLKNRVRQYFQASNAMDQKVRDLVSQITEIEALILECNLIKRYMPKFNVLLRDDKTYPYIKITMSDDYPRLLKTRRIEKDGSKYFGPYTDAASVNQIVDLLNSILRLKGCNTKLFPIDAKPCLNYHIGKCEGVCTGLVDQKAYMKRVYEAIGFLNGKTKPLLQELKKRMENESELLNFEAAATYRDYINAINEISKKQSVAIIGGKDFDVVTALKGLKGYYIVLFLVREGKLSGRETFPINAKNEESYEEIIEAFIEQYYSQVPQIPREILIQYHIDNNDLLQEYLSSLAGRKVRIYKPVKGEKRGMLSLLEKDLIQMKVDIDKRALSTIEREEKIRIKLEELINEYYVNRNCGGSNYRDSSSSSIEINNDIRVEAYDISNINGIDSVGGMIVLNGAKPSKKDYRRVKIRTVEGPDDYASMREVMYRRFIRLKENDPGFSQMPQIIFLDGGIGQVSTVMKILIAMDVNVPVFGMVKDDAHRTRGLVYQSVEDGKEIKREIDIKEDSYLHRYIATLQEEVHRFAIEYHKGLRNKKINQSILDQVKGIGSAKRNLLLSSFGSVEKIKEASIEELETIKGISNRDAKNIFEFFH